MTALSLPTPSPLAPEAPTATLRSGALLHRVRAAAIAIWRLAPGSYLAIPDGDEIVVLPVGPLTRIGRRATSDIVLDDTTVSRRHALVLERAGAAVIADDRSLNGVYVNGRRVHEAPLHHGDEVRIGARIMRYLEVSPARRDARSSRSPSAASRRTRRRPAWRSRRPRAARSRSPGRP